MPELPDVAVFKNYLDSTALHQRISNVKLRDAEKMSQPSRRELRAALIGQCFKASRRHGKYLFAEIDNGKYLVLHFGMTGFVKYFENSTKRPEHTRLLIEFDNEYHLAYDCQRKLGKFTITDDIDEFIGEKELGPDALDPTLDELRFSEIVASHRGAIKSTLMNQQILAGIGNVYSDEILFHAKIHPKRKSEQLTNRSIRQIFKIMRRVLNTAIDCKVTPDKFPKGYLLPNRRLGLKCPQCGGEIVKQKVSGRAGYLCSSHQK